MSPDMNTLFLMGNKRSGTSLLVQLFNLHEKVFITHESDVIWTLYQSRNGRPETYIPYPEDGPVGMLATLKSARAIYQSLPISSPGKGDLVATFFNIQTHLMKFGSDVQESYPDKNALLWIGDKKPVQHADPDIRDFILDLLPASRFIHVVRNPCAVYRSIRKAAQNWAVVPDYWKGGVNEIFQRWLLHEQWVLQAKSERDVPVYSLRYEDIISNPVEQMRMCYSMLELDMPQDVQHKTRAIVRTPKSQSQALDTILEIDGLDEMMNRYGYKLDGSIEKIPA